MTREEATELLKQYNEYSPTKQIEEAIDMAIDALERVEELELKDFFSRHEDDEVYR